ncbi:unnamed protein product [Allacma fusca]|uniref:BTB domain-containing protein n=1 Tax=Allacma fusca TaxID=39272 RepID=A0A8J2NWD7_9HEXA|nr:unnamed protein product [Allacma fusca]
MSGSVQSIIFLTMSGVLSTVYVSAKPPGWTDTIVLDVEDLKGILDEDKNYRCVALVIEGPSYRDNLTWTVSIGSRVKKLPVKVVVSIAGFKEMKCTTVTEITRGGRKYSGESHHFVADASERIFQDLFERYQCVINSYDISKGGPLLIIIKIDITLPINEVFCPPTLPVPVPDKYFPILPADELGDCGADLLQNPIFSDVRIKCEDRIFPAHKIILALRSPVFAKMFESPMEETLSGEVVIDDVKATTWERMLKYLYTGKIERIGCVNPEELLYCAEKYDIPALKSTSVQIMKSLLSEENAGLFNLAVQKCCINEDTKLYFRKYCKERHSILIEKEEYKKMFLHNVELFI